MLCDDRGHLRAVYGPHAGEPIDLPATGDVVFHGPQPGDVEYLPHAELQAWTPHNDTNLTVHGPGDVGGAGDTCSNGLAALEDRVSALGGRLTVGAMSSPRGVIYEQLVGGCRDVKALSTQGDAGSAVKHCQITHGRISRHRLAPCP
jgi:hypothetical protein